MSHHCETACDINVSYGKGQCWNSWTRRAANNICSSLFDVDDHYRLAGHQSSALPTRPIAQRPASIICKSQISVYVEKKKPTLFSFRPNNLLPFSAGRVLTNQVGTRRLKVDGQWFKAMLESCGLPQGRMSGPLLFLLPSALLHQDKDRVEKMFQEFKRVDTKSCNHKLSPHLDLFSSLNLSIVPVQVKI